jgi:hypothetical protein
LNAELPSPGRLKKIRNLYEPPAFQSRYRTATDVDRGKLRIENIFDINVETAVGIRGIDVGEHDAGGVHRFAEVEGEGGMFIGGLASHW